jgi:hypothetical protein
MVSTLLGPARVKKVVSLSVAAANFSMESEPLLNRAGALCILKRELHESRL